jgi:hypothetical protein
MTQRKKSTDLANGGAPSGPTDAVARIATGTLTLGGGTGSASESVPGFSSNAVVFATHRTPAGSVGSIKVCNHDGTNVNVQSTDAADTSLVQYMVVE